MILLVVIFILVIQTLWVYIDELVGKGLGFGVIMEFLFWGSCIMMPLSLPLATLLATMMTVGQMGENNELIALKAAGVSVFRVMLPLLVASLVISVGTFFVINNLVPIGYNEIFTLRDDIVNTKDEIKIPTGTFYDGVEGYALRVEDRDKETGMMRGVMLYDHNGKGNTRLTMADSAVMKISKDKTYLTFKMFNGTNYQETNNKTRSDTTLQLQAIEFSKQEMVIPLENYAFQKSDSARFGDQVKALPLSDLRVQDDSLRQLRDSAMTQQMMPIAAASVFSLKEQLDTVSTSSSRRMASVSFEDPDFLVFKDKETAARAFDMATESARQLESNLQSFEFGSFDYTVRLRWTALEFLRRYGQAIACFIMFFIGAPLGALIRKGGIGVSAIVSLLFFLLYWIIDITGVKLARDGSISSAAGAFASSGVLLAIGLFLTWKAIHDSDLSNIDNLKNGWRKFKSMVTGLFKKTRIVYMGTPDFAVAPLKSLLDNKFKVVGVVTVADKPVGRGQNLGQSAVKKFALERGIPVLQPVRLKDPGFLKELKDLKADLFVVVAFRMLPEEVWAMPRLGTFNLHAALLPQYRGAAPINWAVINGESRTGVTTFMIDKDIDTGGIILRQDLPIPETDTAGDVHDKLMEIGSDLVVQTVQGIIENNVETRVQRSFIQGSEVLKRAPKLTGGLCHIDWDDSTKQVYDLVRGLSPYPAAYTELARGDGQPAKLKILGAERVEGEDFVNMLSRSSVLPTGSLCGGAKVAPGTILTDGKSFFAIATTDGALSLKDVQLAGKKRMDVRAFLAGFRDLASCKVTPGTSKSEIQKARG